MILKKLNILWIILIVKKKISKSLKRYKQLHGVSKQHRENLSKSLKGRNIGCNGDSRSIPVYCIINNKKYIFHNKVQAARWWFDNYPFSNNYAEVTYTRAITKSINNKEIKYNKKLIDIPIKWYLLDTRLLDTDSIYCIYKSNKYEFDTISDAIDWWHSNYPIMNVFDFDIYRHKLQKSINGFEISFNSIVYDDIKWYRKEYL